jgi:hypothetical protein
MKLKFTIVSLILVVFACSCGDAEPLPEPKVVGDLFAEPEPLDLSSLDFKWLEGNWRDTTTWGHMNAQILERWYFSDQSYYGTGLQVKDETDTSLIENIQINISTDPIFFQATVKGQNDGKAIGFELKAYSDDSVYFENMAHSFPQMITYRKITDDSIHAIAAAYTAEGALRRQTSKLKRYID